MLCAVRSATGGRVDTNKTVLIVDDDALVLESIDLLLSAEDGYQCIRALGSRGAESHLQHARIDLLVADVILAGNLTGMDIARRAIERYPDIAVVIITADSDVDREEIPQRWAFLRKPFGAEQLRAAVERAHAKATSVSAAG
jgi:DNA-binding NtrC family response regulator